MGSEMPGPGADAPGPMHVAPSAAHAWATAAATAAVQVPAAGGEAAAWTVRGWADVAIGCLALGAFGGLDEVVRNGPVVSGGPRPAPAASARSPGRSRRGIRTPAR